MYSEKIEALISAALADGVLTEKEKQILFKRAQAEGIDLDEFEMVLDSKLTELKKSDKDKAAPKSDKFGDIRKCPACGAMLQSFQTKCTECGYEFKNIESIQSARKLFDLLQAAELRKSNNLAEIDKEKNKRLSELSARYNSDHTLTKILGGDARREDIENERESLANEFAKSARTIEQNSETEKANIIKNFPVPNSKEDLLELLSMATSNAYDNDGVIGKEEEVWIQKTDQIYQKIIVCAVNDKQMLSQATNMIVSLMKRLPKDYKNFTRIPQEIRSEVEADINAEENIIKQRKIAVLKKYGIFAAGAIVVFFLSLIPNGDFGALLGISAIVALIIIYRQFKKAYKKASELF